MYLMNIWCEQKTREGQKEREIKQEKEISKEWFKLRASQEFAYNSALSEDTLKSLYGGQDTEEMFSEKQWGRGGAQTETQAQDRYRTQEKVNSLKMLDSERQVKQICIALCRTKSVYVIKKAIIGKYEIPHRTPTVSEKEG